MVGKLSSSLRMRFPAKKISTQERLKRIKDKNLQDCQHAACLVAHSRFSSPNVLLEATVPSLYAHLVHFLFAPQSRDREAICYRCRTSKPAIRKTIANCKIPLQLNIFLMIAIRSDYKSPSLYRYPNYFGCCGRISAVQITAFACQK
jgi:hypothetical protein